MAEPQHFCLRWNNYQSSITSAFENLRDDEDFVDVTLACDGRSIKAHRVVLSACSPYFRELLKSTSCKHPVIVLQDVSFLDLHALVEFIYHGEVNVHQNSLSSFLKTAEILRVSGLTQQQAAETNSQLAHIQNLAAQNSTGSGSSSSHRTSLLNHQAFSDRSSLHDDSLYPRGGSSTSPTPPPSLPPHFSSLPHHQQHLPRRPTVYRRDRNNSSISDDFGAIKRHRSDNNGPLLGNPSPDPNSVSPQVTPADFSTIKHNNNNTPPLKDEKRNGPNGNIEKELSPTPSQDRSPTEGDVKSEPMELVCSNNNPNDNNSNDSCNIGDNENNTGRDNPANSGDVKGSLSSGNDDEHENSVQHPAGNFLISPDNKLFPGNFNFMGPLHDHLNFNALQSPNDISSQGPQNAHVTGTPSSSNSSPSPNSIAASSNSISSSSNNNNNIHNNNNADTSPVYIKHPQSPSPTGQLQQPLRMPPPQQGINEPQECPYCKRSFSCYYSLKRHFQDKHEQSDTLYVCEFCQRRYRTKNSLTTHKSLQHRGSSGMLKRLLKTTAIKNVLGSHHRDPFPMAHPRSHFIDFTSDLGQQPPPGIQ
ncbi:Br-c family protein [Megaselia abdita]